MFRLYQSFGWLSTWNVILLRGVACHVRRSVSLRPAIFSLAAGRLTSGVYTQSSGFTSYRMLESSSLPVLRYDTRNHNLSFIKGPPSTGSKSHDLRIVLELMPLACKSGVT